MYFDKWSRSFQMVKVRHLPRTGSDHRMLLMTCGTIDPPKVKYFKFLSFWIDQNYFIDTVKKSWQNEIKGNSMWIRQHKLKRLSKCLSLWSKTSIGNVLRK